VTKVQFIPIPYCKGSRLQKEYWRKIVHFVEVQKGNISLGEEVTLKVDEKEEKILQKTIVLHIYFIQHYVK
jgi:alanyl-tRNA synthetase